jgi:hypothetical protein
LKKQTKPVRATLIDAMKGITEESIKGKPSLKETAIKAFQESHTSENNNHSLSRQDEA